MVTFLNGGVSVSSCQEIAAARRMLEFEINKLLLADAGRELGRVNL